MCGFAGFFGYSSTKYSINHDILSHRGPDEFKMFNNEYSKVFFWRLSIVDIKNGSQPFKYNNIIVFFNGEIFNYKQIKKKYLSDANFKTDSDTEVILHSYLKYGIECFDLFEGMFAITIIDENIKKLILSRDSLGVKPLYFSLSNDVINFSSEIKAINKKKNEINKSALLRYQLFQSPYNNQTLFKDVKKVPPGRIIEFDLNKKLLSKETHININKYNFSSYDEYFYKLKNDLDNILNDSFSIDLDKSFHLSGGLDSNLLISKFFQNFKNNPNNFFITSVLENDPQNELIYAKKTLEHFEISNYRIININSDNFFNVIDEVIYSLDEPLGDPGVVAQFLVNKECSFHSKIIYSGQGLDEMFGGYIRNYISYLFNNKSSIFNNPYLNGWEDYINKFNRNNILNEYLKKMIRIDSKYLELNNSHSKNLIEIYSNYFNTLESKSNQLNEFMINAELDLQLPSLLMMEDRSSMKYSLETRVPFCSKLIKENSLSSMINWNFYNDRPKGIIYEYGKDVLPQHILDRKQKVGRPIPFNKWLYENRNINEKNIINNNIDMIAFLYSDEFANNIEKYFHDYDRTIWGVYSLIKWIKINNISI